MNWRCFFFGHDWGCPEEMDRPGRHYVRRICARCDARVLFDYLDNKEHYYPAEWTEK